MGTGQGAWWTVLAWASPSMPEDQNSPRETLLPSSMKDLDTGPLAN